MVEILVLVDSRARYLQPRRHSRSQDTSVCVPICGCVPLLGADACDRDKTDWSQYVNYDISETNCETARDQRDRVGT